MARVKRGTISIKRRRNVLRHTKGFRWGRKSKERAAREALLHAWSHAFKDRKRKKREFRALWQIRVNAAARKEGLSYSRLIAALKKAGVALDRKILAALALEEPAAFQTLLERAKNAHAASAPVPSTTTS